MVEQAQPQVCKGTLPANWLPLKLDSFEKTSKQPPKWTLQWPREYVWLFLFYTHTQWQHTHVDLIFVIAYQTYVFRCFCWPTFSQLLPCLLESLGPKSDGLSRMCSLIFKIRRGEIALTSMLWLLAMSLKSVSTICLFIFWNTVLLFLICTSTWLLLDFDKRIWLSVCIYPWLCRYLSGAPCKAGRWKYTSASKSGQMMKP